MFLWGSARRKSFAPAVRYRRWLGFLLPFCCAGCLVGPDFSSPSAPVAEKWLEAGEPSVDTRNQEYRDWWKVFHDPVLDRLIETAYNQNLTLVSAGTQVLQARAQLGVAVGEFYPQVQQGTGELTYIRPSHADTTRFPTSVTRNFWRDALGLTVNWELDFWGKFRRAIESADASYLASIANYDYVLATLLGDVATTYIGIRTLQTQIAIARDNIVKQKKALAIAEAKYHGGTATKLDVYQAENVLAQTESTIPQLTIQLNQGFNALAVLLGMPPQPMEPLLAGSSGIPVPPKTVAVGIPADLVRRRPDIRAAELAAMAQGAQIGIAEANLYPAFSLTGTFGTAASNIGRDKLKRVFEGRAITFAFGPAFQWNILNYGQITNQVRVEDAALQTLLVNYQNTVLQAQQQVENGLTSFLQGREQVDYLRESVAAANAALGLAFLQYNLGTRDFTTVLTAEQNLYTAQNNLAMAEGNVSSGLASLYEALGGGWQIRADNEFVPPATAEGMRNRTNWGDLLPAPGTPQPSAPELPIPADVSSSPRPPEW
ncbi:MAG: efflux transporter outer membrane subunit [Alphaproteobacteria bacterium]|nr:efflux transporter outer membrane subunit [Alphaproteobacteria bacterium]MBV9376018.1 efflux transporter outer membrane subunit [Alphaproteobacteria bacterium]